VALVQDYEDVVVEYEVVVVNYEDVDADTGSS
jgi:hypothetical protein